MKHTLEITAVAHGGHGIGRINGQVCFVPYGLPGDTLRVCVTKQARQALWGEIEAVVEPSPHRIEPCCPNFPECGACTWVHFAYPAQAEWKQRIVADLLKRVGKIEAQPRWLDMPELRTGYRTRSEFHGDGKRLGFYAMGTNRIVDTESCPLCHPQVNAALKDLRNHPIKGTVTVQVNPEGREVMLWLPFASRELRRQFPMTNTPKERGRRALFYFDGVPIVNGTFAQASLLLNRQLQQTVIDFAAGAPSVLDLYCGNGNLSLALAGDAQVMGIDHNPSAVKAADALRRAQYVVGDERRMRQAIQAEPWHTLLIDPPRSGAKELMPAIVRSRSERLIYVSCDPATLARDLAMLAPGGWKLRDTVCIDLFPNTAHVETVCLLGR